MRFHRADADGLVTLLFSTTAFAWSVGDDLYVVPDQARCIVQTDHHNVVHVSCRRSADVEEWVRRTDERGFPLPQDVPDPTFETPEWIRPAT